MNLFFIPYRDEVDIPEGVMVVIQDITEHVKLDNIRKRICSRCITQIKNTNYLN